MNWDNPLVKELTASAREAIIAYVMDALVVKQAVKEAAAGTGERYLRDYEDEARWLNAIADLNNMLFRSGKKNKIGDVDKYIAETATPREAKIFKFSVAKIKNAPERARVLWDFCLADNDGKKARMRSISRHPGLIEWADKKLVDAKNRWDKIKCDGDHAFVDRLQRFTDRLDPVEHFQFAISMGDIDDANRRTTIESIINQPVDQAVRRAKAHGYISDNALTCSGELGRWLINFLGPQRANARAMRATTRTAMVNSINRLFTL